MKWKNAGLGFISSLIFISGVAYSDSNALDPQATLQDWLSGNTQQDLDQCNRSVDQQSQQLLLLNPGMDNPTFVTASNNLLLTCLYGLDLVNQSLCTAQPTGCQPVALLVPTSAQIQAAQNPVGAQSPLSTFKANIYK